MKKLTLTLSAIALGLSCTLAHADTLPYEPHVIKDKGFYFGLAADYAHIGDAAIKNLNTDQEGNTNPSTAGAGALGGRLNLGYMFTPVWGIEADLAAYSGINSTASQSLMIQGEPASYSGSQKNQTFLGELMGVADVHVVDQLFFVGKAGVGYSMSENTYNSLATFGNFPQQNEPNIKTSIGGIGFAGSVGFEYRFVHHLAWFVDGNTFIGKQMIIGADTGLTVYFA